MSKAPRGERVIITIVGVRNAGKSSLINALAGQEISIVSDIAGTTTDPVRKHYELLPLGPVTFYDTAGIDDEGELGEKRINATRKILWKSDIVVYVIDSTRGITERDKIFVKEIDSLRIPVIGVFNKVDLRKPLGKDKKFFMEQGIDFIEVSTKDKTGIDKLKELLVSKAPQELKVERVIIGDLISGGDIVVLVVPIDLAAPKGRLILPQVQVIREVIDNDAIAVVVKEREIEEALRSLNKKPALVITDSQVVLKVSGDVPDDIPFTTFSIAFARYKGELDKLVDGAGVIDRLKDGDKVLIAEACSHHIQADDIGRVKIPRWITQYTGKEIIFEFSQGSDFPDDLEKYKLVVHCGGCMLTRMEMMRRIKECERRGVPVTNYGVTISKVHGVLERAIKPFKYLTRR